MTDTEVGPTKDNAICVPAFRWDGTSWRSIGSVQVLKEDIKGAWPEVREAFTNMIPEE